ncbi:hypothetical protein HNY73_020285 [Argiope bruennichi]|uniref:Uncharacterized protein n=1 Tax=Argiope bruennichi TaxID=94029 RepID=A0A8T0E8U6_ARGBR|nr:hypothetical protein HNY73_020285 [Argiope bruennichi]
MQNRLRHAFWLRPLTPAGLRQEFASNLIDLFDMLQDLIVLILPLIVVMGAFERDLNELYRTRTGHTEGGGFTHLTGPVQLSVSQFAHQLLLVVFEFQCKPHV